MPEPATTVLPDDEGIRLTTARRLSEQLERGLSFLALAETLSEQASDREAVAALSATARLIRSNAALGAVILKAAQVEDRRRVFHERVGVLELNPKKTQEPPPEDPNECRRKFEFRMNKLFSPDRRLYDLTRPEDYPPYIDERDLDPSI